MKSLQFVKEDELTTTRPASPLPIESADSDFAHIGVFAFGLPQWCVELPPGFKQKGLGAPFQSPKDWFLLERAVEGFCRTNFGQSFPRCFELYNEPEHAWKGTDEDLVRFFAVAAKAMKTVRPDTLVLGPGHSTIRIRDFDERWVKHGLLDHLDGIVMHAYVSGTEPEGEFIANVRALAGELGDDIWIEKVSLHTQSLIDIESLRKGNDLIGELLRDIESLSTQPTRLVELTELLRPLELKAGLELYDAEIYS